MKRKSSKTTATKKAVKKTAAKKPAKAVEKKTTAKKTAKKAAEKSTKVKASAKSTAKKKVAKKAAPKAKVTKTVKKVVKASKKAPTKQASVASAQDEAWKKLKVKDVVFGPTKYMISSLGRIKSYTKDPDKGKIIKGSRIGGYKTLCVRLENGNRSTRYFHKLVAQHFIKKEKRNQSFVIHLNHNKLNNQIDNLKWATKEQVTEHQKKNPVQQRYHKGLVTNAKLTEAKVKLIKRMLKRNNVRPKMIAKQFGITLTQLNRIKNGENWGYVSAD